MQIKFLIVLCCTISCNILFAQWDGNFNTVNNPFSSSSFADREAFSISDGAGGIICTWRIFDFTNNVQNIYAQRKNSNGAIIWGTTSAPILINTSNNYLDISDIIADGYGGAYISWVDNVTDTTSNLYVQKINANGIMQYTANGLKINANNNHKNAQGKLFADNTGFFITWADEIATTTNNNPTYAQVFAQKYNTSGQPQWTIPGLQVSNAIGLRASPLIIGDGNNGVFIAFLDTRNSGLDAGGDFNNIDIYAQHYSNIGAKLWAATDAIISNEPNNQFTIYGALAGNAMIADSLGGFYIAIEDYRLGNDSANHFYLQRLNNNGTRLLPSGGLALTGINARSSRENFKLINDGFNGVVASWDEHDYALNIGEAHAQRISNTGNLLWGNNNIIISKPAANMYDSKAVCADGNGNYIFIWNTFNDSINSTVIKGQKINNNGSKLWDSAGVPICYNTTSNPNNITIVKSSNNYIAVWDDDRNLSTNSTDMYSAKISTSGALVTTSNMNYVTASNGSWSNAATWVGGQIPPLGADIKILHNIIVNTNVVCNSLTVILPAVLTVSTGFNIIILY